MSKESFWVVIGLIMRMDGGCIEDWEKVKVELTFVLILNTPYSIY